MRLNLSSKTLRRLALAAAIGVAPAMLLAAKADKKKAAAPAGPLAPIVQVKADLAKPDADGFIPMFNGKDLAGWSGLEGFWSVKDKAIVGAETAEHPAPQTFLVFQHPFSDFEMHYKYKISKEDGNSGVQFRSQMMIPEQLRVGGYQADLDNINQHTGSIYDEGGIAGKRGLLSIRGDKTHFSADTESKKEVTRLEKSSDELAKAIKTGDWNDVVLVAKGNHITYKINGELMTDLTDESPKALKEGVIALQLHQGHIMEIQFKDLKIKKL